MELQSEAQIRHWLDAASCDTSPIFRELKAQSYSLSGTYNCSRLIQSRVICLQYESRRLSKRLRFSSNFPFVSYLFSHFPVSALFLVRDSALRCKKDVEL